MAGGPPTTANPCCSLPVFTRVSQSSICRRAVWLLLLLLLAATPASASPASDFDASRAMATVVHLAQTIGERPAGSEGEQLAAGWLAGQYSELGYSVRIHSFAYSRRGEPVTGMNIIATKPGDPAYGTLYVGAHYDTVARVTGSPLGGPGANDNASGTATVLEAARVLASEPLSLTVQFIAFGAEEDGLVGSYHFVDQLLPTDKLQR